MRISVATQREMARRIEIGDSNRQIARLLRVSPTTVSHFRNILNASGQTYSTLASLDDSSFAASVESKVKIYKTTKIIPDWLSIQDELRHPNVTLSLLWDEYREVNKDFPDKCLSSSQFNRRFAAWTKRQRISMRQFHAPGEKMFVDFCGRTMPITNPETGEVKQAQIFVAVLGGSSYTFAYAVSSQNSTEWVTAHIKAFQFFGGVPRQVVPDNLKAAVIKHTKETVAVNSAYQECAEHYGFFINPARVRKPKDKSLAEIGVKIVQRWALAKLRHHRFFSLEELNHELANCLDLLNQKICKAYKKSRLQRFIDTDKPALKPLPQQQYIASSWIYQVKIADDYHIAYKDSYYSVPYQFRFHTVDLRITQNTIEVLLNRQCIASHVLRSTPGLSSIPDHMPDAHRYQAGHTPDALLSWAESVGSNVEKWIDLNLKRRDYANGYKSAKNLRDWARAEQNHNMLDEACKIAIDYNTITFQQLKNIINNRCAKRQRIESTCWVREHQNIRGAEYYKMAKVNCNAQ